MEKLSLSPTFDASLHTGNVLHFGKIMHVQRNSAGGGVWTQIATYFVQTHVFGPFEGVEGINPHCRIDCYVREHKLAPDPETIAKQLLDALRKAGKVSDPIWLSWHRSHEIAGEAYGEVHDFG